MAMTRKKRVYSRYPVFISHVTASGTFPRYPRALNQDKQPSCVNNRYISNSNYDSTSRSKSGSNYECDFCDCHFQNHDYEYCGSDCISDYCAHNVAGGPALVVEHVYHGTELV
jgi:hypothetical protein